MAVLEEVAIVVQRETWTVRWKACRLPRTLGCGAPAALDAVMTAAFRTETAVAL